MKINGELRIVVILVGGTFLIGLFFVIRGWLRTRGIKRLAVSRGLVFRKGIIRHMRVRGIGPRLFMSGDLEHITNLLTDNSPSPDVYYFDFRSLDSRDRSLPKDRQMYQAPNTFSVCTVALRFGLEGTPGFELSPAWSFSGISAALSGKTINLPGFSAFSRRYRLTGDSREKITAFFASGPAFLLETLSGSWHIQSSCGKVIVFSRGLLSASDYELLIDESRMIFSAFSGKRI